MASTCTMGALVAPVAQAAVTQRCRSAPLSTSVVPCRLAAVQQRRSSQAASRLTVRAAGAAVLDAPTEEASSIPASTKIRIKLKAYRADLLSDACDMITGVAYATGAKVSGPVMLPRRRRIFCVLRSPHVNKDSREHFEIRTLSRLIDIKDLTPETIDQLMLLDLPAGVDISVKI